MESVSFFFLRHLAPSIIIWRFIHVVAFINSLFLSLAEKNSTTWIYHNLFILSLSGEHLSHFLFFPNYPFFFPLTNKTAMNIHVEVFV